MSERSRPVDQESLPARHQADAAEHEDETHDVDIAVNVSNADLRHEEGKRSFDLAERDDEEEADEKARAPSDAEPSSRFAGDADLASVAAGQKTLKEGDSGIPVLKLQRALLDLGYRIKGGADGSFGKRTVKALKRFQRSAGVPRTGELDVATFAELQRRYDTRSPYEDAAARDRDNLGTHRLKDYERDAAYQAMVPVRGVGGSPAVFTEDVAGLGKYGDRMKNHITREIDRLHKDLFADKKDLRKDPGKNFHDWSVLEGPAAAGKEVTDALYGSYAQKPAMKHSTGTLIDQWEDELAINSTMGPDELKDKARHKVWYLINSNSDRINGDHSAVPADTAETAILTPIVEEFVNTSAKVQKLIETDVGWEGAELAGQVFVQRYKETDDHANRVQLWELFHTCIHEYIHTLKHADFDDYAIRQDATRENTLIEGFCDFFTDNVRAAMVIDETVQSTIEGPYFKSGQPPPTGVSIGSYPSREQAERVVSIVGIKNAQEAYFKGKVKLIGGDP